MPPADLPPHLQAALTPNEALVLGNAVALAAAHGLPLYLVGGGVRDLLMGRPLKDLDIVVEGDPAILLKALVNAVRGDITHSSRFGTAAFTVSGMNVDVVMARKETYAHPGALPTVTPSSIDDDLWRRDFTINAVALRLHPGPQEILDPTGGQRDLQAGVVRVLHPKSFQDDATRILRAVRYEQRLAFHMEPLTEGLLQRDVGYLQTISGDRLRKELDLAFHEASADAFLRRAGDLGVLQALHPALPDPAGTAKRLDLLAALHPSAEGLPLTHLALLVHGMDDAQRQSFSARLNMPRIWTKVMDDTQTAVERIAALPSDAKPSQVVRALDGLSLEALQATAALAPNAAQRQLAMRYLAEWRHIRPALTGNDLLRLGIPQGPVIKEVMAALLEARLDGKAPSREVEIAIAQAWLQRRSS